MARSVRARARASTEQTSGPGVTSDIQLWATSLAHGLFPHQVEGVAFLLRRRRAILADDMGLGKTRQAIVAARIERGADALGVFLLWLHGAVVNEQCWSDLYSQRIAKRMVGIDASPRFVAVHIFLKLIHLKAQRARVRFEQFTRIGSLAPSRLFAIQHVVHLPKVTLEPGGFSSQRGLPSVFVNAEWEMPEDEPHARVIFFEQFLAKRGETAAGRALKIAKLFQCYRSIRVAANVH